MAAFQHPDMQLPDPMISNINHSTQISVDVLLMVVTKVEFHAVLRLMKPLPQYSTLIRITPNKNTYIVGLFGLYATALVQQLGMGSGGHDASQAITSESLNYWKPRAVIMIGIAFGLQPKKQSLGDVLVSTEIIGYNRERVDSLKITPRGFHYPSGSVLANRFLDTSVSSWTFSGSKVIRGKIVSGEKLVDDSEFAARLLETYPESIGGEMEGYGVAAACYESTQCIIVKGICDFGGLDGRKNKDCQPFAAAAASSIVHHILLTDCLSELNCAAVQVPGIYQPILQQTLSLKFFACVPLDFVGRALGILQSVISGLSEMRYTKHDDAAFTCTSDVSVITNYWVTFSSLGVEQLYLGNQQTIPNSNDHVLMMNWILLLNDMSALASDTSQNIQEPNFVAGDFNSYQEQTLRAVVMSLMQQSPMLQTGTSRCAFNIFLMRRESGLRFGLWLLDIEDNRCVNLTVSFLLHAWSQNWHDRLLQNAREAIESSSNQIKEVVGGAIFGLVRTTSWLNPISGEFQANRLAILRGMFFLKFQTSAVDGAVVFDYLLNPSFGQELYQWALNWLDLQDIEIKKMFSRKLLRLIAESSFEMVTIGLSASVVLECSLSERWFGLLTLKAAVNRVMSPDLSDRMVVLGNLIALITRILSSETRVWEIGDTVILELLYVVCDNLHKRRLFGQTNEVVDSIFKGIKLDLKRLERTELLASTATIVVDLILENRPISARILPQLVGLSWASIEQLASARLFGRLSRDSQQFVSEMMRSRMASS